MSTANDSVNFSASARVVDALLSWYDCGHRDLPWRVQIGAKADPYRVWLSEVMLQQTTVVTVIPYFHRFIAAWPTVRALAAAPLADVLLAWAGLGYYARARNLHACARVVAALPDGRFPEDEAALLALPGIGAYTAAAITAIAFDRPATVVDGNVERVVARLFAVTEPLPAAKSRLRTLTASLAPNRRPGDFAQAMMDLGAIVCTPRRPQCLLCPLRPFCAAAAVPGLAETLPRRAAKAAKPVRRGMAFWLLNSAGAVLLRRRAERGLLGGMIEVPSSPWLEEDDEYSAERWAPAVTLWRPVPGLVRHTFTHFHLELTVVSGQITDSAANPDGFWVQPAHLGDHALPSVMHKVARHALGAGK